MTNEVRDNEDCQGGSHCPCDDMHSCVPPGSDSAGEAARRIRKLERALKARDEFIALTAHELRNPMTPIIGQVDLLMATVQRPENHCSEQVIARVALLQRLIEDYIERSTTLMDLSRVTTGVPRPVLAEVDLSRLLHKQMERWQPTLDKSFLGLKTTIQDGIVGTCDRLAVEQILDNLLSNAIKYGEHRPIEVSLASDGVAARLTVRDHGIGISEEDQGIIFEPFKRAVFESEHGGFGLGLWVVRQLATSMGGEVSLVSALAQGSAFTVTFPLAAKERL
jgi:signal transduction histidine kinase